MGLNFVTIRYPRTIIIVHLDFGGKVSERVNFFSLFLPRIRFPLCLRLLLFVHSDRAVSSVSEDGNRHSLVEAFLCHAFHGAVDGADLQLKVPAMVGRELSNDLNCLVFKK